MDAVTYHIMMVAYLRLKQYEKVLNIFEEALQSSCEADDYIYATAITAASESGQYSMVQRIAKLAKVSKVKLSEMTYTNIIRGLGQVAGNQKEVFSVLENMRAEGVLPNAITYSAAIASCRDFPALVQKLWQDMKKHGNDKEAKKSTILYTAAISSYARAGGDYAGRCIILLSA